MGPTPRPSCTVVLVPAGPIGQQTDCGSAPLLGLAPLHPAAPGPHSREMGQHHEGGSHGTRSPGPPPPPSLWPEPPPALTLAGGPTPCRTSSRLPTLSRAQALQAAHARLAPHAGWLLVLVAGVVLIGLSPTAVTQAGATVFTVCSLTLFTSSATMHLRTGVVPHEQRSC